MKQMYCVICVRVTLNKSGHVIYIQSFVLIGTYHYDLVGATDPR